jgi:hypothetical protein
MEKKYLRFLIISLFIGVGLTGILFYYTPLSFMSVKQKPEQAPQKIYDYYLIIDEKTGKSLMYVPLVVSPGDEVITEENQRFRVIRLEENRAIARYVEDVDLTKYKQK